MMKERKSHPNALVRPLFSLLDIRNANYPVCLCPLYPQAG